LDKNLSIGEIGGIMKNLDVSGFDLRNMRYTGESTQRHEYL
jgi:hypothetical protein